MSTRIAGDIEQMRSTVATMRQSSQALRERAQQSRQALDGLRGSMWSGRHRQAVESRWEAIEPRFNPAFAELEDLAARIERVVNALEAAGAQFGEDSTATETHNGTPTVDSSLPSAPVPTGEWNAYYGQMSWSDKVKDLTQLNQEITLLQGQQSSGIAADNGALQQLLARRQALENIVQTGIQSDGPTPANQLDGFGGCTHYVAEKRDVTWRGNAELWNDNAQKAGYELGNYPVKGSIAVFEPGVLGADKQAGHVAYVEAINKNTDGSYKVTLSEANTLYDQNGHYIAGTHSTPTRRDLTVRVNNDNTISVLNKNQWQAINGLSFIYDKASTTN